MKTLNILVLLILLICTCLVSFLLKPVELNVNNYIYSLSWILFLIVVNWYVSTYVITKVNINNSNTLLGVLPSLHLVVFIYSILSIVMLIISWKIVNYTYLPKWHWILQILAFGSTSIVIILMLMTSKASDVNISFQYEDKIYLRNKVDIIKLNLPDYLSPLSKDLKILDNNIKYFIPHHDYIKNKSNYKNLVSGLENIDFSNVSFDDAKKKVDKLIELSKSC